jgi:hypothetical protein
MMHDVDNDRSMASIVENELGVLLRASRRRRFFSERFSISEYDGEDEGSTDVTVLVLDSGTE